MPKVTCRCTSKKCGHKHGQRCGRTVENPLTMAEADSEGNPVGAWVKTGLCEDCWNRNEEYWKRPTKK